ncbi:hypothetical protein HAX54_023582 [Datura stramonium]|uniref:Uncharacterized protein n=1 Tax=Datura stramonium TaxID=4076 RepID=A0ABS8UZ17_DATST|nr:hypothetical protein [Datura stramonium]
MEEIRADDSIDEEESLPNLIVANELVIINVDLGKTEKPPVENKEDVCEKEKEMPKDDFSKNLSSLHWKAYFDDDDAEATEYLAKLENQEEHYTWIAFLLATSTPTWVTDGGQIYKRDLRIQAKQWNSYQCKGYHCNRNKRSSSTSTYLSSISSVSHDASVVKIERTYENIWGNQVLEIIKIQDKMNLKMKKRKREPVVSHAFETDMGIDSQVANMTVQNNTRLTSLIEHMPEMMKRAIKKDLALVHFKIQDLEHTVSKLEDIGAREALAVLKADMSKVKIDVQQLQSNMSIFDAPLPKDEVFEEERAEIDEEDLEEEQVGAGPSSRAPVGEDAATTATTTYLV